MKNFISKLSISKKSKKIMFGVVALIEILAILIVSTYCWVETVSTIWISGDGKIDTVTYTNAAVNTASTGTVDLTKYFREAGNVHLSAASSADGVNFYFPVVSKTNNKSTAKYRQGTISDVNVNYISFTFNLTSAAEYSYVFKQDPTIKIGNTVITDSSVRLAITDHDTNITKVFAKNSTASNVVSNTSGGTSSPVVYTFANYANNNKANNTLFTMAKNATKKVTVSLWLQTGINSSVAGQKVTIENLAISPNVPTYKVEAYAVTNETSNNATGGTVQVNNGTAGAHATDNIAKDGSVTLKAAVKTGYAFQGWYSAATGGTRYSIDPTYTFKVTSERTLYARFVTTYNVKAIAVTNGSTSGTGGSVQVGTATAGATSTQPIQKSQSVLVKATAKSGYKFVGWYSAATGGTQITEGTASSNGTYTYTFNVTANKTVYARFVSAYTITAYAVTDGNNNNSTGGTVKIGSGTASASATTTITNSESVSLIAENKNGYTFEGWYSAATNGDLLYSDSTYPISNATKNVTAYARFKKEANFTVYFKANHWDVSNVNDWFAVYAWNSDSDKTFVKMNLVKDNIYSVDLGKYYEKVIFCRMKDSATTCEWGNEWNQTADLTVPASNNQYTKNMFTPNSNEWTGANGSWSVFS